MSQKCRQKCRHSNFGVNRLKIYMNTGIDLGVGGIGFSI
jgi:hypothetical protein